MSAVAYLLHVTTAGERWDTLAYRYYGDALAFEQIIAANPEVPITLVLSGGIELLIPIIEESDEIDAEDLPPWKV